MKRRYRHSWNCPSTISTNPTSTRGLVCSSYSLSALANLFPILIMLLTMFYHSLSGWSDCSAGRRNAQNIWPEQRYPSRNATQDRSMSLIDDEQRLHNQTIKHLVPRGLRKLLNRGYLSPSTQRLLGRFTQAWFYGPESLTRFGDESPDFASAYPAFTNAAPSLDRCLLLTFFCCPRRKWSNSASTVMAGSPLNRTPLSQLHHALLRLPTADDTRDCRVWMWMILVSAYYDNATDTLLPKGLVYLHEFQARFPMYTWRAITTEILPGFFWCGSQSSAIERAWT
jgi:hypothetical protein